VVHDAADHRGRTLHLDVDAGENRPVSDRDLCRATAHRERRAQLGGRDSIRAGGQPGELVAAFRIGRRLASTLDSGRQGHERPTDGARVRSEYASADGASVLEHGGSRGANHTASRIRGLRFFDEIESRFFSRSQVNEHRSARGWPRGIARTRRRGLNDSHLEATSRKAAHTKLAEVI
jgi:hypothetical protein